MKPWLLDYLCDPYDYSPLTLLKPVYEGDSIVSGILKGTQEYPIINGIPRFVAQDVKKTVDGFGDQWNYFNYDDFYIQWLKHTVDHTFGSTDYFKSKIIVDAGAGHGMQSRWMVEAGAEKVIALELSHTVDEIMQSNIAGLENQIAVIQCSIDATPLKTASVPLVICHNVIQHTPDVSKTAHELWRITKEEFVWNCYTRTPGFFQDLRFAVHSGMRHLLSRAPFVVRLGYAHMMAALRFVPVLGWVLEKAYLMGRGEVIAGPNWYARAYRAATVITFDGFGAHGYQHHHTFEQQKALALELQPDITKWRNQDTYFSRPMPIGAALRLLTNQAP